MVSSCERYRVSNTSHTHLNSTMMQVLPDPVGALTTMLAVVL